MVRADTNPHVIMIRPIHRRGPTFKEEVAGNLENEIADEENTGGQSVNRVTEAELLLHLELCETHIHSIQKAEDVTDEQERHQAPGDFGVRRRLGLGVVPTVEKDSETPIILPPLLTFSNPSCRLGRSLAFP